MASALLLSTPSIPLVRSRSSSASFALSHRHKIPFFSTNLHRNSLLPLPKASSRGPGGAAAAEDFDRASYKREEAVVVEAEKEISKRVEEEEVVEGEKEISRSTLIWRAVKLPIYSVALVPLSVGSAAAYLQTGLFHTVRYFVLLLSSALVISWLNLSNDVYDFDTGADENKKESVVNILGSRTATLFAANVSLALGFIGLAWGSLEAGDISSISLLTGAILCGYVYQCPPFRLSYHGLGEPLCLAAFGPFATTAFYFSQRNKSKMVLLPLTGNVLSASLLVGMTTSLILFCSHFHQIEDDLAVGKFSPLVRLGTDVGSDVVKVAVLTIYFLLVVFGIMKTLPMTCILLCALTLPMAKMVVDYVKKNHKDKAKIFMAKYYCVRLHALFGAALAAGLVAARTSSRVHLRW